MPINNEGDNLCRATYVPNTKDDIGKYYRHIIKFNNINGSMRIRTPMDIGKGVTLGWIHQAHPAFCFWEDIKERLREPMGDEHKEVQYTLFLKTINYKRVSDGVRLTTTGVTTQIENSPNLVATDFRASITEKWQNINAKNVGTLYGKTFIPFGKEGDMGDAIMTNVIQQQNKFLSETKKRIVHNLSDVDGIIEIFLGEDVDMDPAGISLRYILYNHQDKEGNRLIDAIEKTSTGGTYRFLFQQSKAEEVDTMLEHIDETLNSIGDWEECHTHFRYLPSMSISVVGRVPRSTHPAFWANHLSQFRTNIPSEISTEFLQQPKQQHAAWVKVSYSDAAKVLQGQATAAIAASTAQPSTGQRQSSTSNNDSNSSDSNKQDQPEGAISGLSNLKRKLSEIDKERELYKIEQTKMEDEIGTVTNSISKLGDQMIQMRQDMTALSGNMRAELAEMKNILLGMNKKTASPRRKTHRRTKESDAASSTSNDGEHATAAGVTTPENDLTWDSMCEAEAEHNIRPPPAIATLSTLEDFDLNGVDPGS
jgi:hypothetical protein